MTSQSFAFETILDNEAVLALDLRLSAGVSGPVNLPIRNALLVGIEDGAGVVRVDGAGRAPLRPDRPRPGGLVGRRPARGSAREWGLRTGAARGGSGAAAPGGRHPGFRRPGAA